MLATFSASGNLNRKIAEYTKAVLLDKPAFHVNFIMNVSPECDCWNHNDAAIVPDLGIAASFDPVALDQACADMVTAAPVLHGSRIDFGGSGSEPHSHGVRMAHGTRGEGTDKFRLIHPETDWQTGLDHAEKIGLGERKYETERV
jgi:uncharacterized Fe-S center protein